jgi:hypothetical protein
MAQVRKARRQQVLAYFDTGGVSNGGTEAINLIIEKIRRLAHGFRDFDHYRLRICSPPQTTAPTGTALTMPNSEDPQSRNATPVINAQIRIATMPAAGDVWSGSS